MSKRLKLSVMMEQSIDASLLVNNGQDLSVYDKSILSRMLTHTCDLGRFGVVTLKYALEHHTPTYKYRVCDSVRKDGTLRTTKNKMNQEVLTHYFVYLSKVDSAIKVRKDLYAWLDLPINDDKCQGGWE